MNRAVLLCAALGTSLGWAQAPDYQPQPYYPPQQQQQQPQYYPPQQPYQQPVNGPRLSPQELSNLVAPVALYPDLLLSQVLAASTYPAEISQAQQWMQGNPGLRGPALVDAAKQQNWDPSVQALVAFPDVVNLLSRNVQWTTDLGNAFLSQQADVMDAIQRLRALAQNNGRLQNTPQQRITYEQQNGQSAIVIQPTDPQVVYPPVYNPAYIWGPPVYGYYPPLGYPVGYGITYAVGTVLGALFTGLLSFGGWGWGLSWLGHGLFLNGLFFSHFGFHGGGGYGGGGYGYAARSAWVHNSAHRLGVPYGGSRLASARYGGGANSARSFGGNYAARSFAGNYATARPNGGSRQAEAYRGLSAGAARSGGSYGSGYSQARSFANTASRGNSGGGSYAHSFGSGRGWSAPASQSHYSAPKSSGHSRSGGGGGHLGGGGYGHSGGGHSHGGGHKK
jgi:hypothetical protein